MTHIRPPVSELAFHLFTRPLHPELFTVNARRVIEFDGAWVEVCVLPTGHWITWRRGNAWASEVASDLAQPLPTSRALFPSAPTDTPVTLAVVWSTSGLP